MIRRFGLHGDCLLDILKDISSRYQDKKVFLDVGCGRGERTVAFDGFGRTLHAVDRNPQLHEEARRKLVFTQTDFIDRPLPFGAKHFDLVLCFDVIEHLPEPAIMFGEIRRVLKDDGVLVVSTPYLYRLFNAVLFFLRRRKPPSYDFTAGWQGLEPYSIHVKEYTMEDLETFLKQEGFRVLRHHRAFYGITGWYGFTYLAGAPLYHNILVECKKDI